MAEAELAAVAVATQAAPEQANPEGFHFPYAAAPDIIRANQKDAYFQGVLLEQLSNVLREFYGARVLHKYSAEAKTVADLIYLSLTTLAGARTLGEEYCDIMHVKDGSRRLPDLISRGGYIFSVVLLPYFTGKLLPRLRAKIRLKLDRRAARFALTKTTNDKNNWSMKIQSYIRKHLDTITSTESVFALHLAVFYFSGAYYHLSKRLWGLRYIFTKRLLPHEQRVGYEVLGFMLLLQIVVQAYSQFSALMGTDAYGEEADSATAAAAALAEDKEVTVDLEDEKAMAFVQGDVARKCTLCLELMKDPTLTPCGHMFCWTCISEWCRGKPECPLCRSASLPQHLLVLRG